MLVFGALEVIIALRDGTNLVGEPKVMVIFGCQVKPDGPSILLRNRLDTALEYLENHPDMTVVVTGGKGDDEHQSEARCMYDYLTAHGVDGETILMEDQARNTWQNANYTLNLLLERGYDTTGDVLLVSSGFHLARIEMLWNRATENAANISTLDAPVSHFPSAVQMFFREPLALVKSFLFDR
ncbi:MAG: YdcF family protein [Oscillospiraceae bacterium]|nr:YdcF family protein [Oscillospiraceae bacterium]